MSTETINGKVMNAEHELMLSSSIKRAQHRANARWARPGSKARAAVATSASWAMRRQRVARDRYVIGVLRKLAPQLGLYTNHEIGGFTADVVHAAERIIIDFGICNPNLALVDVTARHKAWQDARYRVMVAGPWINSVV